MKNRESGLELMRILGMLMIIAYHYFLHGGYTSEQLYVYQWQSLYITAFGAFGRMACGAFALTSGYYLIVREKKYHYRRIIPLIAELIFYSFGALAVVSIFQLRELSMAEYVKSLVPVVWGNWYVVNYILLYMLVPFLNLWLRNMNEKAYGRFLMIVLVFWSVIPSIMPDSWEFSHMDFFLVMYVMGGGIRLHWEKKMRWRNRWNLVGLMVAMLLVWLYMTSVSILGHLLNAPWIVEKASRFCSYNYIPGVLFAVCMFLFFNRLRFSCRAVNYLAASMVGIYLIHDNDLLRSVIWEKVSPNPLYIASPWIHAPMKVLTVFLICLMIDFIRRLTVEKVFLKWFTKKCVEWDRKQEQSEV